jgi:hypothetical protein
MSADVFRHNRALPARIAAMLVAGPNIAIQTEMSALGWADFVNRFLFFCLYELDLRD